MGDEIITKVLRFPPIITPFAKADFLGIGEVKIRIWYSRFCDRLFHTNGVIANKTNENE
jgi:hypothetical protein